MAGKDKKNQIIVLEPCTDSVKELLGLVREKAMAEVVSCATPEEAIQNLSGSLPCLLITSLTDNAVVPVRVQLLKRLESVIKQGALKVYMVTGMKNRQLADLFTQKLGVADYIIDPVPARTMLFKVNLALKAVDNFRKIAEQKKAAQEQIVIKKGDAKKPDAAAAPVTAKGKPALQMAEDTFLFKNGGVKKAGKKFVVEVEGPDPSTGEWKQHEDKGDAQSAWRWVPNEEKAEQESGKAPPDGWVHSGDKPTFNEETGKWALSSEKPQLALKKSGKVVAEKVSLDEKGEVVVAEDSAAAEANVQKNREKAAVAIKAREEKKKASLEPKDARAAEPEKQELAKKDPAKAEEKAAAQGKPAIEAKDPKATGKNSPKAKLSLADRFGGDDDGEEAPAWKEEKGEFHNKTGGKKDELRSVQDRRGEELEEFGEKKAEKDLGNEKPAADEKPRSPLDFLKKKKEQLQKDGKAKPASDDLYAEGDEAPAPEARGEPAPGPAKEKKKKSSAIDKLARLKAGLAEPEEDEGGEGWQEENGEFHNKTGGKKDELRSVQDRRGNALEKFGDKKAVKKESAAAEEFGTRKASRKENPEIALKKAALAKMTAKLREPLPEDLSAEEEEEIREELGLKDRPEIKARELAKRRRAAEAERVKALMAEIEEDERNGAGDEETGEVISNGLRSVAQNEGKAPRAHDLSKEKLKGIRAAIDGGDLGEFGEEEGDARGKTAKMKAGAGKDAIPEDKAFYLPEAELLPKGNAWEACSGWYVYLNAETRYKGFNAIEDLLPLWVFRGEKVPELLGKTKQWRFFGGQPTQAKTASEVPSEVLEYLLGIRDQLASAAAKEKKKDNKAASLLDKLKRELDAEDSPQVEAAATAPEPEAEDSSAEAGGDKDEEASAESTPTATAKGKDREKKNSGAASLDALKRLREKMKAAESLEAGEEAAAESNSENEESAEPEAAGPASALERLRKQLEQHESAPEAEKAGGEDSTLETEEIEAEGERPAAKKKGSEAGKMSELERLRRELDGEDVPEEKEETAEEMEAGDVSAKESPAPAKAEKKSSANDALKRLREQLQKDAPEESGEQPRAETEPGPEAEAPPADETPEQALARLAEGSEKPQEKPQFGGDRNEQMRRLRDQLTEKMERGEEEAGAFPAPAAAQSEGVKKFLERRKNKTRGVEKTSQTAPEAPKAPAFTVYLGLFVAVSDALSQPTGHSGIPRVLKAFEDSFGKCRAFYTGSPGEDGMAKVRYSSSADNGTESAVKLEAGRAEAIPAPDGGGEKVMGYLFLQPESGRDPFGESEAEALRKVAAMLWPVLARETEAESNVA